MKIKPYISILILMLLVSCSAPVSSDSESIISESQPLESSISSADESISSSEESISSMEESSISSISVEPGTEIHVSFLSSDETMGKVTGELTQTISYGETFTSKVTALPSLGYCFVGWSDGYEGAERENESFVQDCEITAIFDYEAKEMPILALNTNSGKEITSKTDYVDGSISIFNCDDAYKMNQVSLQIRGRGNYTWGLEKKPYRIKFDSKVNLMGQGKAKAKSWTLIANHCDKSLSRNDAAFYFSRQLDHISFTSSSSFAEVYFNGRYDGVYEICDQIQVNDGRVDIDDTGTEDDIGYLVELDKNASENVISIDNGDEFEIKSDFQTDSQKTYIKNWLQDSYDAIVNGDEDTVSEYIDIDSAVDCYLVEELFKNLDVGWGSFYFTKPKGEKLQFGPVWDFDLAAGNADSDDYYNTSKFRSYKYTYVGNPAFDYNQQSKWYLRLRETSWFEEKVKTRWAEVKDYATATVTHISDTADAYPESFKRNFSRWKIFTTKINREPDKVLTKRTFKTQVSYLTDWLTDRIDWLDGYYAGTETDYTETYW